MSPKVRQEPHKRQRYDVSIPFEWESVSKAIRPHRYAFRLFRFRFLSSGKVSPKFDKRRKALEVVRFRFPSSGKVYPKALTDTYYRYPYESVNAFRFPSSGKVSPKQAVGLSPELLEQNVSIPFKRESVSKGILHLLLFWGERVSIPFARESVSKV